MQQNHKGKLSNPVEGLDFFKGCLQPQKQARLVELAREIASEAPFFRPAMPRTGKPLSVQMTNCGKFGWLTDQKGGYRYQEMHPETGRRYQTKFWISGHHYCQISLSLKPALSTFTKPAQRWGCIKTAMSRISRFRFFRFRWATPAVSESEEPSAEVKQRPFCLRAAMC